MKPRIADVSIYTLSLAGDKYCDGLSKHTHIHVIGITREIDKHKCSSTYALSALAPLTRTAACSDVKRPSLRTRTSVMYTSSSKLRNKWDDKPAA